MMRLTWLDEDNGEIACFVDGIIGVYELRGKTMVLCPGWGQIPVKETIQEVLDLHEANIELRNSGVGRMLAERIDEMCNRLDAMEKSQ